MGDMEFDEFILTKTRKLRYISPYNIFVMKYIKGLCGCMKLNPINFDRNNWKELIIVYGLRKMDSEASVKNMQRINYYANRVTKLLSDKYISNSWVDSDYGLTQVEKDIYKTVR